MSARTTGTGKTRRTSAGRVQRRGTVLLMVVGVLALMSIVAVVYVTIGQADRRGAAALVREQRLDDQSKAVGDYLATIIANDATAVQTLTDPSGLELHLREAWDVASFSTAMRTTPGAASTGEIRFDPVGQGVDPWLSDPEPTWLRYVRNDPPRDGSNPVRRYLDNMDWGQISDPWPDGRFVNIGNIRGNFGVEPGRDRDGDQRPRTSWGLTQFMRGPMNPGGGDIQPVGTPQNPQQVKLENSQNASTNAPYHWATRQVNAFRPYRDVDKRAGKPGVGTLIAPFVTISDPRWLPNQWVDTDGDGLVDARWSDMVDCTDPIAPRPILRADGSMRFFVATRIIDLSGLVNVNTAGDMHVTMPMPPDYTGDNLYPLGLTPGDVDLRSLLTMGKLHDILGLNGVYEEYEQPQVNPALPSDYSDGGGAPYDNIAARETGFAGYSALRAALREGQLTQGPIEVGAGGELFGRAAKYDAFQRLAAPEGARHDATGAGRYLAAFRFGIADQAELLTYWGTNDPNVTSALETTIDGRWTNSPSALGTPESRFGPLRSIRPLSVERDGVGNFFPAGSAQTAPHVMIGGATDGLPDDDALLKVATDPRHLITTVSGARPIVATPVSGPGAPLTASEVAVDVYDLLEKTGPEGVQGIFRAYCQALLPWSSADLPASGSAIAQPPWVIEANDYTAAKPDRARTLSYGWRGPELPLWMSAFMAVNLKDAYDIDHTPTSFTLVIDNSYKTAGSGWSTTRFPVTTFPTDLRDTPTGGVNPASFWPVTESERVLDLGELTGEPERIASTQDNHPPLDDVLRSRRLAAPAVNIFGVEAQPFLTQVAMFACFTDAPQTPGDDDTEYQDSAPPSGPSPGDGFSNVSISGEVREGNPDFLFQVITFQIHNPFESSVTLPAGDEYTLQFGGSRFQLKRDVTLSAKGTKIFYCVTPGRTQANTRISGVWVGGGAVTIEDWLMGQLGYASTTEVDDGELDRIAVTEPMGSTTEIGESTVLNLLDANSDANRVVLLWRREGAGATAHRILVDRMRDPELTGVPSLDRTFDLPDLDSSVAPASWPDDVEGTDAFNTDDTGFSLMTFGSFRRPDDPGASGAGVPLGAIPAFCLERRGFATSSAPNTERPLNVGPVQDPSLKDGFSTLGTSASMNRSDFAGSLGAATPGKTTLAALLGPQQGTAAADILLPSIKENPRTRTGHRIDTSIAGIGFEQHYMEAFLPNNRFRLPAPSQVKTLRPTDLMLPWALGSWQLPGASGLPDWESERRINPALTDPPLEWATLSEMIAMALDYEAPAAGRHDLFFDQTHAPPQLPPPDVAATEWRAGHQAYDRGCLRIDRFAPFLDSNNDLTFNVRTVPPPDFQGQQEDIVPPGIPLATTIVDRFKVRDAGSLTRSVPGLININTAPLEVLRALPGVTPPSANLDVTPDAVWFWTGVQDSTSDIGSTMLAYRDNIGVYPRDAAGGLSSWELNFRPDNNPTAGPNGRGRRRITGVQALHQPFTKGTGAAAVDGKYDRSENGFRSIGETMIVRDQSVVGAPPNFPYNIDRLGHDGVNVGGDLATPVFITDSTTYDSGSGVRPNQIVDDYQEQFAISGALMNSISVRSDVFAAWFVVRGYTVNDVEGLEIQEPMVPSVERRFLMIIDRSNVTQRGQKPRILLFKELPM